MIVDKVENDCFSIVIYELEITIICFKVETKARDYSYTK